MTFRSASILGTIGLVASLAFSAAACGGSEGSDGGDDGGDGDGSGASGSGGSGQGGVGEGGSGSPGSGGSGGAAACTAWPDVDGDGHGDASGTPVETCDPGPGFAASNDDCDDADAAVHPGAQEATADGVDGDCDGQEICFVDADGDGYRPDGGATIPSADPTCSGDGVATAAEPEGDCNDDDAAVHPGAMEVPGAGFDADCDQSVLCFVDGDEDGYRTAATAPSADRTCSGPGQALASVPAGDCNDGDAAIHPGAQEAIADGVDQDCDAKEKCYADADDDGFRPNASATALGDDLTCTAPGLATAATPTGDCYDDNPAAKPGQMGYFSFDRGDGSYDYDCNNVESPESTAVYDCIDTGPSSCLLTQVGWANVAPPCGDQNIWVTVCLPSQFGCGGGGNNKTQACR